MTFSLENRPENKEKYVNFFKCMGKNEPNVARQWLKYTRERKKIKEKTK